MFRNYLKTALRNLSRNKVYSSINIIGLSLGLACAMLIVLYSKDELSFDRFHAKSDRIYEIAARSINPDGSTWFQGTSTGIFQGPRFAANIPEIESFVRIQRGFSDFRRGADITSREILAVDNNFFSVFSFPLKSGNAATALSDPQSVVISEKVAKEYFGNEEALGKVIEIKNGQKFEPHIVSAVAKATPENSSILFDILLPYRPAEEEMTNNMNWLNFHLNTFIVLSKKASAAAVERKMNEVFNREAAQTIKDLEKQMGNKASTEHLLVPLTGIHLNTEFVAQDALKNGSKPIYSYILSGVALFILLIACINFINLTIARSLKRAKEIGIRKVVGGERRQLIMQFLGESFLICSFAFLLSIALVQLALPAFNELANKSLSLAFLIDAKLVAIYTGLFFVTALLAGFYPALVLSGFNPVKTLYSRFNLPGKNYLQKSLVVLQFSLATLLILATFTIYAQFNYLTNKDLGYDDKNLVLVETGNMRYNDARLFKEMLLSDPNIEGVALKNRGRMGTRGRINNDARIGFDNELIDANFLPLHHIPIVQGRNFSPNLTSDSSQSVLVNETFVRTAGWKDPIGQFVDIFSNGEKYRVVGVVKDYHYRSLSEEIGPQLFAMNSSNRYGLAFIRIKPNSESASLEHIAASFKKLFPLNPFVYKFKDVENRRAYESEAKWKQMMLFGAILTIFISCIGLFGLSVLAAEKRTKEIGIRKVLGASPSGLVAALSKDFLKLVIIALLIAIPTAWYFANDWLQNYPYRTTLSWQLFALAGLLVVLIALVTVSFQSVKAARSNPVRSLRSE